MGYKPYIMSLETETERTQLVPRNQRITEVAILNVPVGASFRLALGDHEMFYVDSPITLQPRGDEVQNHGLYFQNDVAQPGVEIEVIVSFDGSAVVRR